ncbi:hypothetical protein BKA70DRAFT_1426900 [Coprinopsis sp. MPI-PUGE-AT-0042]|nr:hypothetical protein BKA70DRAFT_1426900 [Coprinopsis sp. MPI-PUGE-AT-0042]
MPKIETVTAHSRDLRSRRNTQGDAPVAISDGSTSRRMDRGQALLTDHRTPQVSASGPPTAFSAEDANDKPEDDAEGQRLNRHEGANHDDPEREEPGQEILHATIERMKRQLVRKQATGQRARRELKEAKEHCSDLQEELDEKEGLLREAKKNELQYRNWWLNEIQFTKLLLNKVPDPNRDIELVRASQAHYLGHY